MPFLFILFLEVGWDFLRKTNRKKKREKKEKKKKKPFLKLGRGRGGKKSDHSSVLPVSVLCGYSAVDSRRIKYTETVVETNSCLLCLCGAPRVSLAQRSAAVRGGCWQFQGPSTHPMSFGRSWELVWLPGGQRSPQPWGFAPGTGGSTLVPAMGEGDPPAEPNPAPLLPSFCPFLTHSSSLAPALTLIPSIFRLFGSGINLNSIGFSALWLLSAFRRQTVPCCRATLLPPAAAHHGRRGPSSRGRALFLNPAVPMVLTVNGSRERAFQRISSCQGWRAREETALPSAAEERLPATERDGKRPRRKTWALLCRAGRNGAVGTQS
ncbi:uncharacterized protein LOC110388594 [Numida meleagris]|uniref:uncharacterized protein LOC110388594 n=1 Tax=Numida meleagris TaxID=8996 RepID=UPI000B3E359F|nr:uncharacterized protein LOC110388594 [Numida meleagris]